ANKIYSPSYVSLESALAYYHLIPESVYHVTSVATKKTISFETQLCCFRYCTLKPKLFTDYIIIRDNELPFKIANPEKAIFDFLYLKSHYKSKDDFYELRINSEIFKKQVNRKKFDRLVAISGNHALYKRAQTLWEVIKNS
ncbi:MAG: hypothetical protein HY843_03425, partial [Bdellovibrio sp.]|nr:hypothetical protein [Bdellovibrio sp.]